MPFTLSHYLQRAAECETVALQVSDSTVRARCLELARRFREMAYVGGNSQTSDAEIEELAERMLGKKPRDRSPPGPSA